MLLGPLQLLGADPLVPQASELAPDDLAGLADVFLPGPDVHGDHAPLGVLLEVGADRVCQAALLANLPEQPRGGRAAEDRVEDAEREPPLVRTGDARSPEADVVLLGVLRLEGESGCCVIALPGARGTATLALGRGQEAPRQLDDLRVLEVSRGGGDEVRRRVPGVMVGANLRDGDRGDHLGIAQHPPAERVVAVHGLREDVVNAILRLVLVHRDLLEHDLPLGVDLVLGQRRPEQHLGEEPEGILGVLVEEPGVKMGGLLAGGRVRGGAHAVEELRDLDRRVTLRALEQQVLEEVGDPGLLGCLVAGASADPEPEGDRAHRGHLLGDHLEATG